jgi:hypothetical protein
MKKQFRDFESARKFAQKLGLKSSRDWIEYYTLNDKLHKVPRNPAIFYKKNGWASWGDFLGTGITSSKKKQYRSFKESRKYVRNLKLKNAEQWHEYCKSGNKPDDIPRNPVYYRKEYEGMGDWLGTGYIASQLRTYLPFKEARAFVISLNLKGQKEWNEYCKSGNKPDDIPRNGTAYKKEWKGIGDWLGTGNLSPSDQRKQRRSFKESRKFARNLKLKGIKEWKQYCKSGNKPDDIPANPISYSNEWINWGDFLGTNTIATQNKEYLSAKEAKPVLQKLFKEYGIKNKNDWLYFAKTHGKLLEKLHLPSGILRTYSLENAKKGRKNE